MIAFGSRTYVLLNTSLVLKCLMDREDSSYANVSINVSMRLKLWKTVVFWFASQPISHGGEPQACPRQGKGIAWSSSV